MTLAIEVQNLRLNYGSFAAIDGLSFRLQGGSIYGLLGRNGSGKTTLMSVLAGFRMASAGEVRIGDEPVFENPKVVSQVCLIREGGDTVDGDEDIEEAFRFAGSLRPNWDGAYALYLADRFQLSLKKKVGQLSRGSVRRSPYPWASPAARR
jgi:ABC-2 type transport system ATP-binding protein